MKNLIMMTLSFVLLTNWSYGADDDEITAGDLKSYGQVMDHSSKEGGLTDDEYLMTQNYEHAGLADDILADQCEGKDLSGEFSMGGAKKGEDFSAMCENLLKGSSPVADQSVIDFASKMYGTITMGLSMMSFGGAKVGGKAGAEEKDQFDPCPLIAQGGVMVSEFIHQGKEQELMAADIKGETAQRQALHKAEISHTVKAQGYDIQAGTFYTTAGCYAIKMASQIAGAGMTAGDIAADSVKMAGAFTIGTLLLSEAKKNRKYAEAIAEIKEKLPSQGDCNPITDTLCYCSHPTTQNDPVYCGKAIAARMAATTYLQSSCLDKNLKEDPNCSCTATNNCYDQTFFGIMGNGGFDSSVAKNIADLAKNITNGKIRRADATATDANRAIADISKQLENSDIDLSGVTNLSKSESALAKALSDQGVPKLMAAIAAKAKPTGNSNKAKSLFSGSRPYKKSKYKRAGREKTIRFSGGRGLKKASKNSSRTRKSRKGKKGSGSANQKVLKYANRAHNAAQISNEKDRSIFEVISRRYQLSRGKLD